MSDNHIQQNQLLRDLDFIRVSVMLKPDEENYLRTIDPDNLSKANRIVIDRDMNRSKKDRLYQISLIVMVFMIFVLAIIQFLILGVF